MTPAERLERLLGRGANEVESSSPPVNVPPDAAAPSADLAELAAIAKTLRGLDLPMSPERSAALRELLEAEAGRTLPSRPDGGPVSRGRLPWLGGIGILLLLTMGLWLSRTPKGPTLTEPLLGGTVAVTPAVGGASAILVTRVDQQTLAPGSTSAFASPSPLTTAEGIGAQPVRQDGAAPLVTDRGARALPSASPRPPESSPATAMTGTGSGLGVIATRRAAPLAPSLPGEPEAATALPPGWDGYLRGRVTDATGRPIADAEVTAHRVDRVGIFVQRTGIDGRFDILLPWGSYRLEARASGFASRWYPQVAAREAAAILIWAADAPAPAVEFELPSAQAPVTPGG